LRDRLLAATPGPHARRAEADAEAVLEAHGFASRPGPRVRLAPDLMGVIGAALEGPHVLTVVYAGGGATRTARGGSNPTACFSAPVAIW
jgi:hypothetical protein